jgi:hypothetical protein
MAERVLFRQDGANARTVVLEPGADGGCRLVAYDRGDAAEAAFGRRDHEAWISIAGANVSALCQALLADRLGGQAGAVADLEQLCRLFDVPFERGSW